MGIFLGIPGIPGARGVRETLVNNRYRPKVSKVEGDHCVKDMRYCNVLVQTQPIIYHLDLAGTQPARNQWPSLSGGRMHWNRKHQFHHCISSTQPSSAEKPGTRVLESSAPYYVTKKIGNAREEAALDLDVWSSCCLNIYDCLVSYGEHW